MLLQRMSKYGKKKQNKFELKCHICDTPNFVDPWLSKCKHVCCGECWVSWLHENNESTCPACDAPVDFEELESDIDLGALKEAKRQSAAKITQ
mmetsp:Transcript_37582/g.73978  ORF Transcript_37582/g.73978 Transcript_37582/m.73978 type:complete len:93 (+) Transcript_37582:3059-3337(+)